MCVCVCVCSVEEVAVGSRLEELLERRAHSVCLYVSTVDVKGGCTRPSVVVCVCVFGVSTVGAKDGSVSLGETRSLHLQYVHTVC